MYQKYEIYFIFLNAKVCKPNTPDIRGCTGFDGGFAIGEAIRGPGPRSKPDKKYKRRRKLFVSSSLMLLVGLGSLTA